MDIEDFQSGHEIEQAGFKAFVPAEVNHAWSWRTPEISIQLEAANHALGQLDAYARIVPDVDQFIRMHVVKEAHKSSRIEGTQTRFDEALLPEDKVQPERRDDWTEVQNYIQAMNESIEHLTKLPLSNRLIRQAHHTLMQGVRGHGKLPGEFRTSQNWIGGSKPSDALFVPPPADHVPALMSDLEKFWHNQDIAVPHLIRIAISHYQFETIHPFLDGNGRIGRLLITLYLVTNRLLSAPTLYLSDFFDRHRGSYYDALTVVRASNNIRHWVSFFLNGVTETAERGRRTFEQLLELREDLNQRVLTLGARAGRAQALLTYLYLHPTVQSKEVAEWLDIAPGTAIKLLGEMEQVGILREATGQARNRWYVFDDYLRVLTQDN